MAEVISADTFIILTGVEKVEREISRMTVADAKRYLQEGHFLAGSMGPKVKACIRFIEWGGKRAIVSSLDKVTEALDGKTCTEIVKG